MNRVIQAPMKHWKMFYRYALKTGVMADKAEDFASYAVLRHISNPDTKSYRWQIYADWVRSECGRDGNRARAPLDFDPTDGTNPLTHCTHLEQLRTFIKDAIPNYLACRSNKVSTKAVSILKDLVSMEMSVQQLSEKWDLDDTTIYHYWAGLCSANQLPQLRYPGN